uniref:Translation initiation factor eIF2B subunit delta n=1 Tax=Strigamia maritima TaxID=126957 RepID=T1JCW0_STRMM
MQFNVAVWNSRDRRYKYRLTKIMDLEEANGGKSLKLKSNFQLNPEAAIFLPNRKYLVEESSSSYSPPPPSGDRAVERTTSLDERLEKEKMKAERKAKFEAERAAKSNNEAASKENEKSKAETRAERRAKQEAQRAAKTKAQQQIPSTAKATATAVSKESTQETINQVRVVKAKPVATSRGKRVHFLSHLRQYKSDEPLLKSPPFARGDLHPAMLRLGLQIASGAICGSNARCIAFLQALKQMIVDYVTPSNKELCRDLDDKLDVQVQFLQKCRPISVSTENAVSHFKRKLTAEPSTTADADIKSKLLEAAETYVKESILYAGKTIAELAFDKICDGDVILVFAHSSVVNTVLKTAFSKGTRFHVVVVDSRPKLEGLKTKTCLVRHGIECTYTLINAISYTMQKVTKVFLGAHALLANGYVMSRVGTAQVALVAKAYNVPVLICCETHKFTDKVQIDSFVYNELGNPEDLVRSDESDRLADLPCLDLLHLMYDVTPPDLVSAAITEIGMLPCTSVPVVLRLRR